MESAAAWPVEDLDVDLVGLGRRAPVPGRNELGLTALVLFRRAETPRLCAEERRLGVVNGLAIHRQPLAHRRQALDFRSRNDALRVWTDIQQIVTALARDVDEVAQQYLRRLEVHVVRFVTPRVVHRHAGLP